jgi:hypothetical protein
VPPKKKRARPRSDAQRAAAKGRTKARNSDTLEGLARLGMATRGLLYGLIGVLALQIAVNGDDGEKADKRGAFATLSDRTLGRVLLAVLALGFLGYALWRLVQAGLDPEGRATGDRAGAVKRVGYAARGLLYAYFFVSVLPFVFTEKDAGDGDPAKKATDRALDIPLGRWVIAGVAVCLIGAGLWNGYRAVSGKFRSDLDDDCSAFVAPFALLGLGTRMALYGTVGGYLLKAALESDPGEAVGLDGALHRIGGGVAGTAALVALAVGLIAFGGFCVVQARYRRVFS